MKKWGSFVNRHIGPKVEDVDTMLKEIGVKSLNQLIEETVPAAIRSKKNLDIPEGLTENEYLLELKEISQKNKVFTSFLGLGYYNSHIPNVIKRNVLENPGWYTAYTPYQAEIAQGRMEALLNFQTITMELTGLPIANASLLDEGTAAAEALVMFFNSRSRAAIKAGANKFFISENCFPQTIDVVKTKAVNLGVELIVGDHENFTPNETIFGAIVQYPDGNGAVNDYKKFTEAMHSVGGKLAVATDLLSLILLTPPALWGADVAFGNSQRFGVPLGYGGPHAAFFAATEDFKRNMPGRIIGVSKDAQNQPALRMALQTREQHIRREKATSNICTAQALLAVMASMYAVYHGPEGLKHIATEVHQKAVVLSKSLEKIGFKNVNTLFFDTLKIKLPDLAELEKLKIEAEKKKINLRYFQDNHVGISLDETTTAKNLNQLLDIFADLKALPAAKLTDKEIETCDLLIKNENRRKDKFLNHPVFNLYHSETEMMRYLKRLENRDLSLTHSMIPLGSCTMKLNAAAELYPITWPEFANIHPFAPVNQTQGYQDVIKELNALLSEITGFDQISFQPNSGAQGEYAGLLVIKAYHQSRGDHNRNVVLIPSSAHGTNPASAVMAGLEVVVTKCDEKGNVDLTDLKEKAEKHKDNLCALMITYPSTHGVFEEHVTEITSVIHGFGGQVYMDGANMNAQVGLTSPGIIGADVCHLNLHKTFAIPHGGGGPGMGPIGVKAHLTPFLPGNPLIETGGAKGISAVASAPWGSALILLISYGYIKMLGAEGVKKSTEIAILNANYLKTRLEKHYDVLYKGRNGRVAHEMILECRGFKKDAGIEVEDIAKRLMDYGFHAPTVSFPVAGTLMVEPTESESKEELDRFAEALIHIRAEIQEVIDNADLRGNNVLENAPHTLRDVVSDWTRPYPIQKAITPLSHVLVNKFWPSVNRVNNAEGDRNLICSCIPIEAYEDTKDLEPV